MRKRTTRIVSILLAVVIFGGAFFLYRAGVFDKDEPQPGQSVNALPAASRTDRGSTPVEGVVIEASNAEEVINVNGSMSIKS